AYDSGAQMGWIGNHLMMGLFGIGSIGPGDAGPGGCISAGLCPDDLAAWTHV
ncbi:hypothetical protein GOODEAATRI_030222, partial [Goodea atripinnis]